MLSFKTNDFILTKINNTVFNIAFKIFLGQTPVYFSNVALHCSAHVSLPIQRDLATHLPFTSLVVSSSSSMAWTLIHLLESTSLCLILSCSLLKAGQHSNLLNSILFILKIWYFYFNVICHLLIFFPTSFWSMYLLSSLLYPF